MKGVRGQLKTLFQGRPIWMNAVMLFCFYMVFIYMPFDMFFKPLADAEEVWFGVVLKGWAARATEPLHWAIYAAGAWGFCRMRPWMWPWASLYVVQVAISMFVWTFASAQFGGFVWGSVACIPFIILAVALWRAKLRFQVQPEMAPGPAGNHGSLLKTTDETKTG